MLGVVFLSNLGPFGPRRDRRGVSEGPRSRRWRRHGTAAPPRRRCDPTRVYVVIRTPSDRVETPRCSAQVDTYGTQQPITLLLTLISRGFIYDRDKDLTQKVLRDMTYISAMGPPGGGRNNVDPRFVALFSVFNLPDPTSEVLKHMYSSIINERLRDFSPSVKDAAAKFPDAMLELFSYILESQYPRLAIAAPRPSERPERGHDLLHMDETVSRELKPNLNFSRHRPPADAREVPLHFQFEGSFEGHGGRVLSHSRSV